MEEIEASSLTWHKQLRPPMRTTLAAELLYSLHPNKVCSKDEENISGQGSHLNVQIFRVLSLFIKT